MTSSTRRNLLRRAHNLVVVSDGAYRWVGQRREVHRWLRARGKQPGYDTQTNQAFAVRLDADAYQALCDETHCVASTCGTGQYAGDPRELIDAIERRGAGMLTIL